MLQLLSIRANDDVVVDVPEQVVDDPHIVVALHGMGPNCPDLLQHQVMFDELADETGLFIVVYPLGEQGHTYNLTQYYHCKGSVCIGSATVCGHTWNGGACCFSLEDDTTFLLEMIRVVKETLPATAAAKIFLAGFSAGGVMAHRIGCDHADLVTAVVSVSGRCWLSYQRFSQHGNHVMFSQKLSFL